MLNGCKFVLEGFEKQPGTEKEIVVQIEAWGGSIENKVAKSTTALIIADKSFSYGKETDGPTQIQQSVIPWLFSTEPPELGEREIW